MFGRCSRPKTRTWSEITSVMRVKRLSALPPSLRSELIGTRCASSATTVSASASTSLVLSHRSISALAPVAPYMAIGGFQIARCLLLVHHGRILHTPAQACSQRGKRFHVARLLYRQIDVIRRDPVLQPYGREQASRAARDGAGAGGGYYRYAH